MLAKTSFFQKEQNLSVVQITTSNQNSFNYISGPLAIIMSLLPHQIARLAAMPMGFALAWLGYALWSERREQAS